MKRSASLMQRVSVRENRGDAALLRALGAACEKIHRLPEARAWYRLAIDLNPLDPVAQKALYRLEGFAESAPRRRVPG